MKTSLVRLLGLAAAALLALFLLIQLVPYGRSHQNPAPGREPAWDAPQTREIAQRACFDCHSDLTVWPWYSNVAPVSWLVQRDVDEGREKLNFTQWGTREQEADEAAEVVEKGEMPLPVYLITHPEARLSAAEKTQLVQGLQNTFGEEEED
jgi:mono/diheme cytochrome c family protein